MKSTFVFVFFCLLTAAACTSQPEKNTSGTGANEKSFTALFSDTLQADTFKVALTGKDSKNSMLIFRVINAKGKEIYQAEINGAELLKANQKLKTEADRMQYLRKEVNYFFEEEHFLEPAVMPDEQPDKNVPDTSFYNELKNTGLNGFNFRTGAESKVYIGWSGKDQKVKVYYKCC